MRTLTRLIAGMELALILPAALFLTAVLVGAGDPPQYGLAHAAQGIVRWYSARMWTLWLLLVALPLVVLVTGCATLLRNWKHDLEVPHFAAPLATLFLAGVTLASASILAVVVLHMLAN